MMKSCTAPASTTPISSQRNPGRKPNCAAKTGPMSGPAPVNVEQLASQAPTASAGRYDAYTVQRGDSLWSIAAKPEVYGKATRWRRIFDANRNLLPSPDRLKAGMVLQIPQEETDELPEDKGSTYAK